MLFNSQSNPEGKLFSLSVDEEVEVKKNNFPKVTLGESGIYGNKTQHCVTPSPIVNSEQLSRESSVVKPEDKEAANLGASLSSP